MLASAAFLPSYLFPAALCWGFTPGKMVRAWYLSRKSPPNPQHQTQALLKPEKDAVCASLNSFRRFFIVNAYLLHNLWPVTNIGCIMQMLTPIIVDGSFHSWQCFSTPSASL